MYSYAVGPVESPKGLGCLGAGASSPVYHLSPAGQQEAGLAAMSFRDAAATHKVLRDCFLCYFRIFLVEWEECFTQ